MGNLQNSWLSFLRSGTPRFSWNRYFSLLLITYSCKHSNHFSIQVPHPKSLSDMLMIFSSFGVMVRISTRWSQNISIFNTIGTLSNIPRYISISFYYIEYIIHKRTMLGILNLIIILYKNCEGT